MIIHIEFKRRLYISCNFQARELQYLVEGDSHKQVEGPQERHKMDLVEDMGTRVGGTLVGFVGFVEMDHLDQAWMTL